MKFTICIYNLGVGNTELLIKKIAYWQKKGVKVKMVCPKYIVSDFDRFIDNLDYIPIPFCLPVSNKLLLIFELLKRTIIAFFYMPQIIKNTNVVYSISSVLDALLLPFIIKCLYNKTTWVALFENEVKLELSAIGTTKGLAWVFYQISLQLLKKTDKIFVISNKLESLLLNKNYSAQKLILTGNAIDKKEIRRAIQRKKYVCDGLFMGRLNKDKGVFDIIYICKKVVSIYPNFSLYIAGTGDNHTEKNLYKLVSKLNLKKNIKFLGYISGKEKYQMLAGARIFIFPSRSESFGVALLEAVCSGTRAVTYNLPIYKQIYRYNEIETVEAGDIEKSANKIIKIMHGGDFINVAGLKLLNSKKYNYDKIAQLELDNFYRN